MRKYFTLPNIVMLVVTLASIASLVIGLIQLDNAPQYVVWGYIIVFGSIITLVSTELITSIIKVHKLSNHD